MNMNILEQEDLIKGAPDDLLLQEAQAPSGNVPQFLVVSEIQRRKQMRDRFSAQEQQPEQTVTEQIVAQSSPQMPPQGIGALQPQMPPQMPPQMQQPSMPPEMMAAAGGRMPYRRMAGGGMIPPNSLVEDASKFNPQSLHEMDASQMAMANPTNMGIASVLPMAAGGFVRMNNGGYAPYQSAKDAVFDKAGGAIDSIIDYYSEEDGTTDWGKVAKHAALVGISFTPWGLAARGAGLAGRIVTGKAGRAVMSNIARRVAQKLGKKIPENAILKGKASSQIMRENPLITSKEIASSVGRGVMSPIKNYPKIVRGGALGLLADSALDPRTSQTGEITNEIANQVEAANQASAEISEAPQQTISQREIDIAFLQSNSKASGGIIKMNVGTTLPSIYRDMTDDEIAALADQKRERDSLSTSPNNIGPRSSGIGVDSPAYMNMLLGNGGFEAEPPVSVDNTMTVKPDVKPDVETTVPQAARYLPNTNQQILDMISQGKADIEGILARQKDVSAPDYEALKASIEEGVEEDSMSAILMSMAKSIYEGKGLAGADVSQAQAIRQKAKDSMNAIILAESKGASEREMAALNNELQANIAMLSSIPSLQARVNPTTGMTTLGKLQYELSRMEAGDPNIALHKSAIGRLTDPKAADEIMKLIDQMRVGKQTTDEEGNAKIEYGISTLNESDHRRWMLLLEGNQTLSQLLTQDLMTGDEFKKGGLVRAADGVYRGVH